MLILFSFSLFFLHLLLNFNIMMKHNQEYETICLLDSGERLITPLQGDSFNHDSIKHWIINLNHVNAKRIDFLRERFIRNYPM